MPTLRLTELFGSLCAMVFLAALAWVVFVPLVEPRRVARRFRRGFVVGVRTRG